MTSMPSSLVYEFGGFGVNDGGDGAGDAQTDARQVGTFFEGEEVVEQRVRGVERGERREFGAAVAFVDVFPELELERFAQFGA